MSVTSQNITAGPYSGNDVATTFAYPFKITDKTEIIVAETDINGVETILTVDVDFTLTGINDKNGGDFIRTAGALPTGYTLYARANYLPTQETDFESQGGFFPDVHESAMDKLTRLIQQIIDQTDRTIKLSDTQDTEGADLTIPGAVDRATKYLYFDENGDVLLTTSLGSNVPDQVDEQASYLGTTGTQLIWKVLTALATEYDNTETGMAATTVQAAIDEIDTILDTLGTAATADLTTDQTDTVGVVDAGLGFFGFGNDVVPSPLVDFDSDTLKNGVYNVVAGTDPGTYPDGEVAGSVFCFGRAKTRRFQLFAAYSAGFKLYKRGYNVGAYETWKEIWHTGNLDPTVDSGLNVPRLMKNVSGGSIANNASVGGASLAYAFGTNVGALGGGGTPVGTWVAVLGKSSIAANEFGYFVRIA